MFRDIVLPSDNEGEFVEIALKLGIKKLYFLYDFKELSEKLQKKIENVNGYRGLRAEAAVIANNIGKLGKKIPVIVKSSEKDRVFAESGKISMIYGFEEAAKRDFLHQRASGLNHILCDLLKKNDISVGFSYNMLQKSEKAHLYMGRMLQNIRLCRKFKLRTAIASFSANPYSMRSPHDTISLFSTLGMDSKTANEALSDNL